MPRPKTTPTEYAVLDVETTPIQDNELPCTLFWGYADETGYYSFTTTRKLLSFLRSHPPHVLLHHTNFDVLQLLLDGAEVKPLRSHNGRLIRSKLGNHLLLNSYSVFPVALGKIFNCFGFEKTSLDNLEKRNYEDCVNGLHCFLELDALFEKLCSVSPLARGTIAGTAFDAAQLVAGKMSLELDYLEAYRGGRVEVFNLSEGHADKFDINSSYPRSFIECPLGEAKLLRLSVKTKDFYCPFFDASRDDMLLFPNGNFETWCYEDTLEKYILPHCKHTHLRKRQTVRVDTTWVNNTVPLIEKLYRTKQEATAKGQEAISLAAKLLLNSMYGRMGMKGESERVRLMDYRPDVRDGTIFKLGKKWLVFDTVFRQPRSNYPLAAYITCNARARLYRAFAGSDAHYGDTDSVITPQGASYFDHNETLGEGCGDWKHEGREVFRANNVKDYFWGEDEVRKGGSGSTVWTMKRLAAGLSPAYIQRDRISELRKRLPDESGVCHPVVVNK